MSWLPPSTSTAKGLMPASGEVLLDTSVVIPFLKKDDTLRQQFQNASTLYLP